MLLKQLSSRYSINMLGHTTMGAWQGHLIPLLSLHGERGIFPVSVPNYESVVGMKSVDSGVVFGYHITELPIPGQHNVLLLHHKFILGSL